MSSNPAKPEILGVDELKTEAKWLKLERIRWRDQEGKEVGTDLISGQSCSLVVVWLAGAGLRARS